MKRDASRTRGDLAVQASLPAGQPPVAPIWARRGGGAGVGDHQAQQRRGSRPVGFRMARVPLVAVAGNDPILALREGNAPRVFLSIRNASTSAGSLLISFGVPPLSVEACDFELTPGAVLLLDGYSGVPQDDVWIYSTVGASGSIAYGDQPQ